jgi:hypothetical protein
LDQLRLLVAVEVAQAMEEQALLAALVAAHLLGMAALAVQELRAKVMQVELLLDMVRLMRLLAAVVLAELVVALLAAQVPAETVA